MKTKKHSAGYYIGFLIFIIVALINIYPMVFSIFCSFKGNLEIFSSFTANKTFICYYSLLNFTTIVNINGNTWHIIASVTNVTIKASPFSFNSKCLIPKT